MNGLRTFSRPDIDEFEEINLKFAIDQTIDLISEIYKKEGINIAIDNISDEIVFKGTIGKFQQILMNLLSNAKDALENAKNPKIEVKTEVQDNFIKVHVIDNGDGISKEHGEKIFNAFYTTKGFGSGTGMGLSISSNLAKDIGGKLEFYSELGTGTKFTILLPVASESRFIATKIDVKNVSDQRTLNDSIKNILVVDDEEDIREILVEILSENNCNVVEANNGKQALDKIANNSFDLIITDIKMPIMDGIELIKNIRNMKQIIQPIIVASTGGATNLDTVIHSETSNHFVDGYLLKPFSIDEIPISLNDIIEKFNSKKEKRSA